MIDSDTRYIKKVLMDDDCEICEERIRPCARRHAHCIELSNGNWQITIMCHKCWCLFLHYSLNRGELDDA